MDMIILDGTRMTDLSETHRYLAEALEFPVYYGANLDALADCLSELGSEVCVMLIHFGDMRDSLGEYADRLLDVFDSLSQEPNAFRFIIGEEQ